MNNSAGHLKPIDLRGRVFSFQAIASSSSIVTPLKSLDRPLGLTLHDDCPWRDLGTMCENLDDKIRSTKKEDEADKGARDSLIPPVPWQKSDVRNTQSAKDAVALADRLRIHPVIVAGRVRHETENWRLLNGLLGERGDVRKHFEDQLGGLTRHSS